MKRILELGSLVGLFTCLACSDPAPGEEQGDDLQDMFIPADSNVVADAADAADVADSADAEEIPVENWELEIQGSPSSMIYYGQDAEFTVKLFSASRVIPNRRVTFAMLKDGQDVSSGYEGTRLSALNVTTNEQGLAAVRITAGQRDVSFQLEASAQDAHPVYWSVVVAREDSGALAVKVRYCENGTEEDRCPEGGYPGRYLLSRTMTKADVRLYQNANCPTLLSNLSAPPTAFDQMWIDPFTEIDNLTTFTDLDNGTKFTVLALGVNNGGSTLATACGTAEVVGGENTLVELVLNDLPIDLKGTYTVINKFDLTDILRSTSSGPLAIVADALEIFRLFGCSSSECPNRGSEIVSLICGLFGADNSICNTFGPLADVLIRIIDGALFENGEQTTVAKVFTIISDVLTIAGEMTTVGQMEFRSNPEADGSMSEQADDRWQKFRFNWRNNCTSDCTREFTIGALGAASDTAPNRDVAGTFDSSVEGMKLAIGEHSLTFKYGKILLGIAEQWLFPRFSTNNTNEPLSFEELMAQILPCAKINSIFGDGSQFCEEVLVPALSDVVIEYIGMLEFEADQFKLYGSVDMVDEDANLSVDRLENGVWHGVLQFGSVTLGFNGCFAGCRGTDECSATCTIPDYGSKSADGVFEYADDADEEFVYEY